MPVEVNRFLLDTHVLLWSLAAPERLDPAAREAIRDPGHVVFVSTASVWELAIKAALGKLTMPDDLDDQLRLNRFDVLDITFGHARAVEHLPPHHRDPFDRMLIAQARVEGLTLITRDPQVQRYGVSWIPA